MAESDHHTKGKGNDITLVSASSESDAVNHVRMNGIEGEASVGLTSCLEADKAEEDLNSHSEILILPEANSDEGPKDTAKPDSVADKSVQDPVMEAEDSHLKNGIRLDSDGGNHTITPIPLVNGFEKATGAAVVQSDGQNDIWSPATKLKRRLEDTKDLIVCPGVYDGFSARIALSVGFDTMYMTGAGTTASRLGMADLGVASRTDMKEHADMIANLDPSKMLIAAMDTGYGGPITITTTVNQYIRANVAGFHIEDQLLTKRCGHLAGKRVVSREVYLSRIKAAKAAKDRAHSDIVLIARTDANQQHGYEECLARLRAARDVGADVGLLEGFKSKDEARRAVQDLAPWPLLLNVVENGHSPLITVDEAREMGFRIMIFSFGALVPAYLAIKKAFERLKTQGVTGVHETGISPRSIFDVCGLEEAMEIDEVAGGEDFKGGV